MNSRLARTAEWLRYLDKVLPLSGPPFAHMSNQRFGLADNNNNLEVITVWVLRVH